MFHGGMLWGEHLKVIYDPFSYITGNIDVPHVRSAGSKAGTRTENLLKVGPFWMKEQDVKQLNLFDCGENEVLLIQHSDFSQRER